MTSIVGVGRASLMSSSQLKRIPFFSGELSDQTITVAAVVGIVIWALLLVSQEHNINMTREHIDERSLARETLIALQSYAIQIKELAVYAEGYALTGDKKYLAQYSEALVGVEEQSGQLDRYFEQLKHGKDASQRLQELVAHEKTLINAIITKPVADDKSLNTRQLLLLNKQQEFITVEEKRVAQLLRNQIDAQDAGLKVYKRQFFVTKHLIMFYSTLLVLGSFGLVIKERRLRRYQASIGLTPD
jgi:CHASE3 domain sensor protein